MILLFIIVSILYLIMIYAVLSLYYRYRKDIEELENRLLQLEKRINEVETNNDMLGNYYERTNVIETIQEKLENRILQLEKRTPSKVYKDLSKEDLQELRERWENEYCNWLTPRYAPNMEINKESEVFDMACGTKGRPRGRRTTSRGGGRKK